MSEMKKLIRRGVILQLLKSLARTTSFIPIWKGVSPPLSQKDPKWPLSVQKQDKPPQPPMQMLTCIH